MPNYRRYRVPGGCYFFTVNLYNRSEHLLVERIDLLREAFTSVSKLLPFYIDAAVILPDHLHTMWTLPPDDADYATRWKQIKAYFSRRIDGREAHTESQRKRGERGIWQRRFWEHTIADDTDYERHVDYIHFNPVKHGHVLRPIDWPHSTFHRYVREGGLSAEWGTDGLGHDMDLG